MKSLESTKKIEFKNNKKIKEEDLDISVNIRWEGFPYSYSKDKIKIHNVHLKHKPTGLTYSIDSNTGFDTGYKYALEKLEKLYNAYLYYNNHGDRKAN